MERERIARPRSGVPTLRRSRYPDKLAVRGGSPSSVRSGTDGSYLFRMRVAARLSDSSRSRCSSPLGRTRPFKKKWLNLWTPSFRLGPQSRQTIAFPNFPHRCPGKIERNSSETAEPVREGCLVSRQNQCAAFHASRHGVQGVEGSNPFAPTKFNDLRGPRDAGF